jgi:catechol 2,3-dioxygenase-like lactoylglutathione lyase family enzyme
MAELVATASISDVCFLVQDLERAIAFYRDRVGFKLRRLAPGFADFFTAGVTLALWQVDHMQSNLHLPPGQALRGGWRTMEGGHANLLFNGETQNGSHGSDR